MCLLFNFARQRDDAKLLVSTLPPLLYSPHASIPPIYSCLLREALFIYLFIYLSRVNSPVLGHLSQYSAIFEEKLYCKRFLKLLLKNIHIKVTFLP